MPVEIWQSGIRINEFDKDGGGPHIGTIGGKLASIRYVVDKPVLNINGSGDQSIQNNSSVDFDSGVTIVIKE